MLIDEYVAGLTAAGFVGVQVVDTHKDLGAYALVEGPGGCCAAPTADGGCCRPADGTCGPTTASELHEGLARYDVNEFAASVRVYGVKPLSEA